MYGQGSRVVISIRVGGRGGERTERGSGSVAVKREKRRERLRFRGPTHLPQHARPPVGWLVITRILSLAEPRNIRHNHRIHLHTERCHPIHYRDPERNGRHHASASAVTSSSRSPGEGGGEVMGMSSSWQLDCHVWESPAYHPPCPCPRHRQDPLPSLSPVRSSVPFLRASYLRPGWK